MKQLMKTDVLVVGGGLAGIGAALGAARQGVSTILLEKHAFFGGVASWCLGMPINQMRTEGQPRSQVHELLIEKLSAYGDRAVWIGDHELRCNVEYLKVAILDALDAAGCRYLVHAHVVDTRVENNRVTGVVIGTPQGLMAVDAQVVVDGSGDGDVSYFAGADTLTDPDLPSPMTLCLNVGNVDADAVAAFQKAGGMARLADAAREEFPLIPERWGLTRFPSSASFIINHGGTKGFGLMDATDPEQLSDAECRSHRQAIQMVEAMRKFGGEALKNVEMMATGPQIGVRPRRRVKGLYLLTEEDAVKGAGFEDAVAWRSGFLDIGYVRFEEMKIHQVPYRALLPEKLDGLLAAGRCISATHVAASAGKSMGNCMATGHAAGIAAALSVQERKQPRELSVQAIQDRLRAEGVDLDRAGDPQEKLFRGRGTSAKPALADTTR